MKGKSEMINTIYLVFHFFLFIDSKGKKKNNSQTILLKNSKTKKNLNLHTEAVDGSFLFLLLNGLIRNETNSILIFFIILINCEEIELHCHSSPHNRCG